MSIGTPINHQKMTQHSCCSMLTREKKLKAIRGNGYRFVPKGGTFPTENNHACCEKHIPKPAPNGTKSYHNLLSRSMIACPVS